MKLLHGPLNWWIQDIMIAITWQNSLLINMLFDYALRDSLLEL